MARMCALLAVPCVDLVGPAFAEARGARLYRPPASSSSSGRGYEAEPPSPRPPALSLQRSQVSAFLELDPSPVPREAARRPLSSGYFRREPERARPALRVRVGGDRS